MEDSNVKELKEKSKELIEIINKLKGNEISENDLRGKFLDGDANFHIEYKGIVYQFVIHEKSDDSYFEAGKKE